MAVFGIGVRRLGSVYAVVAADPEVPAEAAGLTTAADRRIALTITITMKISDTQ
jgi:hypothetical protein